MRKLLLLLLIIFKTNIYSQSIVQKVVLLHQQTTYTVNSKNYMGSGKTIIPISVFLPENTKEIIYSISSSKRGSIFSGNTILSQSLELLSANPVFNIAGNLLAPTSDNGAGESYKVNTFFMDDKNYQLWATNLPNMYFPDLSRDNITKGIVGLRFPANLKTNGRHWLILKNENDWTGVDVSIEVIAITEVEDFSDNISSSGNTKSRMYNNLAWNLFKQGDFEKALETGLKALDEDENNGIAKCNLGIFCLSMDNSDAATNYFVEAIDVFKRDKQNGKNNLINEYNKLIGIIRDYEIHNIKDVNLILELMRSEMNTN
ncbi:tetratricopeptide repeat protein [Capnocytophaga canimorsus]|nr:tetratricopeptide repeat protein [Capnocytophaga canimorsus]WGU68508.1 tetratricopeptide repeat protein [Capnocytophaga canimorsus]WGU70384.1 tetratricopeptide repeat protein [Capnocytophaga canimorsus]